MFRSASKTRLLTTAWLAHAVLFAARVGGASPRDNVAPPARSGSGRRGRPPPPVYGRAPEAAERRAQTLGGVDPPPAPATPGDALDAIVASAKRGEDGNTRLRHDLIRRHDGDFDKYNYDKHSYPWDYVWYNDTEGQRTGVPVEVDINFHKVSSVDIIESVMDLSVWFRLAWVDPRLSWDPAEYDGLTKTWFWIGDGGPGGETSEIWAPDVELWNLEVGLSDSLDDAYAAVSHDGTVFWSRPGHLRPVCRFEGLEAFPFDKLKCAMEIGSWTMSGKYIQMVKKDGVGWKRNEPSVTRGESYAEFQLADKDPITCKDYIYTYDVAPEDDWPVLIYTVAVKRSWEPYARGYIFIQILLNFVGFTVFWLPPSCGERMSLSITAMLAALASEIVVAESLPVAQEWTWFAKFSMVSLLFAFVSLLECVIVLALYYKCDEDFVPSWYAFTKKWYFVRQAKKQKEQIRRHGTILVTKASDSIAERTSNAIGALHHGADARVKRGEECSQEGSLNQESNDSCEEFASVLSRDQNQPPPQMPVSRDANDYQNDQEMKINVKWKLVAAKVDDIARFWIPVSYVVAMAVLFAEVW